MGRKRSRSDLAKKSESEDTIEDNDNLIPNQSENSIEDDRNESGSDEELEAETTTLEADSDDEPIPLDENTVGDVPMHWYDEYDHIGYNIQGDKIARPMKKDLMDSFLDREDQSNWRRVWDEKNQREVILSVEEMKILRNIQKGKFPEPSYNPYQEFPEIPRPDLLIHPLLNTPEPKSRFVPSKWEAKKIAYLAKAIRKGWIKFDNNEEESPFHLLWDDDQTAEESKRMKMHIPPPPTVLPKHNESYNPPDEYLLDEEEKKAWELLDPQDRPFNFLPQKFDRLRKVPGYEKTIEERFERCLDLYLCPRAMVQRAKVDPDSLLPKLPSPKDLQPFPTTAALWFDGHTDKIRSVSVNPTGQWLISGSDDQTVKLWEICSARCINTWKFNDVIRKVVWNPNAEIPIFLVAVDKEVMIVNPQIGSEEQTLQVDVLLAGNIKPSLKKTYVNWTRPEGKGYPIDVRLVVSHGKKVDDVKWHFKGDYFACVSPDAVKTAVLIHRISQKQSQNPFRKMKGRVQCVAFHPNKPFFFVATQRNIRVYNLTQQSFMKKLIGSAQWISSISVHPGGDNLIIGSYDKRVCWYDMDYSAKPYRTLKYHKRAVRNVVYHNRYPLFASCSDDGTVHVFHGMVYNDLLQNPLLVPVKILKGHEIIDDLGILDCTFHPTQPWLITSGADGKIILFT